MTTPIIGITTYHQTSSYGFPLVAVARAYTDAVSQVGGIPVLIPLGLPDAQIRAIRTRIDGIIFSGGGDIDPQYYGMEANPKVKSIDLERDHLEIQMVQDAVEGGLPFLGICRGLQTINVALGGTLYYDVADQHPNAIKHDYFPDFPRDQLSHAVKIESSSRLEQILGTREAEVNSLHHQGVDRLASKLRPIAYAPDELIEGVEYPDHPFGMAVQWHPEWLTAHQPMRNLFKALVEAAVQ